MAEIVKSFCARLCGGTCGILVTVNNGRVESVKGDPDSPFGGGGICAKGHALPELMYHPKRLLHPLKRIGARGEGKWQQVTMGAALEEIASRLKTLSAGYGPESIMLLTGASRAGLELAFTQRFASVLGTPNHVSVGNVCHVPREAASTYTFGSPTFPDYKHPPKCFVIWGSNPLHTNDDGGTLSAFKPAFEGGTRFIVIDPRNTPLSSRAELQLRPRPGSDGLLALAFMNVIIREGLYDRDFVSRWTVGFEQLQALAAEYPPEKAAALTWVPAEQIEQAARLYATIKPASIQWGNAIDHTSNAFQTCRAISILRALTGNLDVPGGDLFKGILPLMKRAELFLLKNSARNSKEPIGSQYKLYTGMMTVPSQEICRSILEEKPYPLKAALVFGSNTLLSYPNSRQTAEALRQLDLLVVADAFMSPTAALADFVLPVAINLEYNDLGYYGSSNGYLMARRKVVEPPGECASDPQIINLLAEKMGMGEYFWKDELGAIGEILKPAGVKWEELLERGVLWPGDDSYRKWEKTGFRTPSGKVELYSARLEKMGYDPVPVFREARESPYGSPDLAKEYPLVLTSAKDPYYFHSMYRQMDSLRKLSREPVAEMNPEAAAGLGLKSGDLVYLETPRGKVTQRLRTRPELDPRVVYAAYGWWFPEKEADSLFGWDESNVNMLTDSAGPLDPQLGTPNLRGIMCRVTKA